MTSLDDNRKAADSYSEHICYNLNKLKTCRVQHVDFSDRHAQALATALRALRGNRIRKLEIYKCPLLSSRGISFVVDALSQVYVERLDLSSVHVGDEGMQAITQLIEASPCLTWLSLEDIGPISLPAWSRFFLAAMSSFHLKSLELSRNELFEEHMTPLANGLRNNTTLESLILSENPIGDEGVEVLCRHALTRNSSMMLLALGDCEITERGLHFLLQCLRGNFTSLERLYLYANPLDESSAEKAEVTYWLDLNAQGRGYFRNEDCQSELVPRILTRSRNSPKLLYGLLQELPHVWVRKN